MKTKILLTLLCAVMAFGANAQESEQRQKQEYPAKELIASAKLSDEQVAALKANEATYQKSIVDAMKDREDRAKMQEAIKLARTTRLLGIRSIIKDDVQYVTYLEYEILNPSIGGGMRMNSGRQRSNNNGGGNNGGGGNFGGGGDFGGGNN
ncbi:MAG: hypothetical protein KBH23_07040 [Bacteroidaceae bacterium]|nr:hypothetical protein [Bacteroidaceae bacterium]MBP9636998.1 hypothetical protein [Bacteroidaceae bacterium]